MKGTEKQIKWAGDIRARKLAEIAKMLAWAEAEATKQGKDTPAEIASMMAEYHALETKVAAQDMATWWIDRQDWTAQQLLREAR